MRIPLLIVAALAALASAKDDCPAFSEMSSQSECLWMKNAEGKMSIAQLRDTFIDKCNLEIDWKGQSPPDITDKHQIDMPDKCGMCPFKIKCASRAKQDGCFPLKAESEQCTEHADVCEFPMVPNFKNCRWSMLASFMQQCVTARPDLAEWEREGYSQGGRMFPQQNCLKKGDKCMCCCHPYRPTKDGAGYKCVEAAGRAKADACPAFAPWNDWTDKCLWYPLSQVARDVNEHCQIGDLFPGMNINKMLEDRIKQEKEDPNRASLLAKLPENACGYCSFKLRCRKRAKSDECFGFDADKKTCGADECDGCAEPCSAAKLSEDLHKVPKDLVGTCDYTKYIMSYLKGKAMPMLKMLGNNYWKKRGFMQLMKFLPMGKCVVGADGNCKCCCHPYEPSEDGSSCQLRKICQLPRDMGLKWDVKS